MRRSVSFESWNSRPTRNEGRLACLASRPSECRTTHRSQIGFELSIICLTQAVQPVIKQKTCFRTESKVKGPTSQLPFPGPNARIPGPKLRFCMYAIGPLQRFSVSVSAFLSVSKQLTTAQQDTAPQEHSKP